MQRFYRSLGLALLNHAENGVEQDDDKDDEHLGEALAGQSVRDCGNGSRRQQYQQHRVFELLEKALEDGRFLRLGKLILTVLFETLFSLLFAQPGSGAIELCEGIILCALV